MAQAWLLEAIARDALRDAVAARRAFSQILDLLAGKSAGSITRPRP